MNILADPFLRTLKRCHLRVDQSEGAKSAIRVGELYLVTLYDFLKKAVSEH